MDWRFGFERNADARYCGQRAGPVRISVVSPFPKLGGAVLSLGLACPSGSPPEVDDPSPPSQTPPRPEPLAEGAAPTQTEASDVVAPSLEARYETWRRRFDDDAALAQSSRFDEVQRDLSAVANEATDLHLRANAALLLGALYEARKAPGSAEGYYRLAAELVPDDAGPKMALALALAAQEKFAEAAQVQAAATALDPDNLENWLLLGELWHKADDDEKASAAYVDYERRRKGLIDGLTLTRDGNYLVGREERIGCATALAVATDQGTAVALAYALRSDPDPVVRAAVAQMMGLQRLGWYRGVLEETLTKDADPKVRAAVTGALAEITRDPVDITQAAVPEDEP